MGKIDIKALDNYPLYVATKDNDVPLSGKIYTDLYQPLLRLNYTAAIDELVKELLNIG